MVFELQLGTGWVWECPKSGHVGHCSCGVQTLLTGTGLGLRRRVQSSHTLEQLGCPPRLSGAPAQMPLEVQPQVQVGVPSPLTLGPGWCPHWVVTLG